MKETAPVQLACSVIGAGKVESLKAYYHKNPILRFLLISVALISQVIGLLLVCFIGIVIGSLVLSFLR